MNGYQCTDETKARRAVITCGRAPVAHEILLLLAYHLQPSWKVPKCLCPHYLLLGLLVSEARKRQ